MNSKRRTRKRLSEDNLDKIVESQANDDSSWEKPVRVVRGKSTSLRLSAELAPRAAFLAKLHKEKNLEAWLIRIIKERVELEEVAFGQVKRELSLRDSQ